MGNQLKHDIREYMRNHPGVKYTEARNTILSRNKEPMLTGVMSDMLSRIVGAGTPAPDLETAMRNLGFDFPPDAGSATPLAPSDVQQGDVIRVGNRFGLVLTDGTALLDGKIVDFTDTTHPAVEFYRMAPPLENSVDVIGESLNNGAVAVVKGTNNEASLKTLSVVLDEAVGMLPPPEDGLRYVWTPEELPVYAAQRGDIIRIADRVGAYNGDSLISFGNGETLDIKDADEDAKVYCARAVSPPRQPTSPAEGVTLTEVVGTGDITARWEKSEFTSRLPIPLGYVPDNGRVFGVDLAELSRGGTGPHMVLQGVTGSGKSVLLRNIVEALASENSPTKVNFAFADFKGGATFYGYEKLPHLVFRAEDIESDTSAFGTFKKFVYDEITRREELLRSHHVGHITDYTRLRAADTELPPLAHLFVIADDFQEFMLMNRSSVETFEHIAAKGRSLGIHLVLCAQFIDPALLSRVLPNIALGISLKAGSASYSRVVLNGDPGATALPVGNGDALVRHLNRFGNDVVQRIRTLRSGYDPTPHPRKPRP